MKVLSSVIILGIGFLMASGGPARAQYGDLGDAVKKDVGDAVIKGAADKAGMPAPGAPAAAPAADPGAAVAPGSDPGAAPKAPAVAADAPAGAAPKVPAAAGDAPARAPVAGGTAPDAEGTSGN